MAKHRMCLGDSVEFDMDGVSSVQFSENQIEETVEITLRPGHSFKVRKSKDFPLAGMAEALSKHIAARDPLENLRRFGLIESVPLIRESVDEPPPVEPAPRTE